MSKLLRTLVFLALILSASDAFAQHTYYISKSLGNDASTSTQAQSKSTSWQHVPGMAGCTSGTACSYTPQPGDQFILYGGDTWTYTDLPLATVGNGTGACETTPNSSCIYIGVDQTWYNSGVCGSSWCRPIFSNGGHVINEYAMAYLQSKYYAIDNIEFTGLATSAGNTYRMVAATAAGDVVEHCYFHGWNHAPSGDNDDSDVINAAVSGTVVHDNVIDGSDTLASSGGMMTAIDGASVVYRNIIRNVTQGIFRTEDIVHDNWIGPILLGYTGGHKNGVQIAAPMSLPYILFYNNIVTQVANGGMGQIWVEQSSGNAGIKAYLFNNVEFNTAGGNNWDFCQLGSACGPIYAFNNTTACGDSDGSTVNCTGTGGQGPVGDVYWINNHCIQGATGTCSGSSGSVVLHEINSLVETFAQADSDTSPHFQQYTKSETYAYSPVASTNSTVGAGLALGTYIPPGLSSPLCTTIATLNAAAGAACQNSTSYACTYNTGNHTVNCPADPLLARPASAAWDIGAYQFSSSQAQAPQAPANLQATVQ